MSTIGIQMTIPELTSHMAHTRLSVGLAGEILVARALEARGYPVRIAHEYGDLNVVLPDGQIVAVEVKTSRRGKDGIYRFTLWKHWEGRQCADHKNSDFVILLCILRTGNTVPFVIPTLALGDCHALAITSAPNKYKGRLAKFRQNIKKLILPAMKITEVEK